MAQRRVALGLLLLVLAGAVLAWPRPGPAAATGTAVQAVSAGQFHTCAVTTTGGVKCWGSNSRGQLGNGSTPAQVRSPPVDVLTQPGGQPLDGITALAAGNYHTCAVTAAATLECWGDNRFGQLGVQTGELCTDAFGASYPCSTTAVEVESLEGVAAVGAGYAHTCAVGVTGWVKCWGWNAQGQLGDGTTASRSAPVDACLTYNDALQQCDQTLQGVVSATGGYQHTCALTAEGGVKCWGSDIYGGLGASTTASCPDAFFPDVLIPCSTTPLGVEGLAGGATAVSAGSVHSCALVADGGVKCWGLNGFGQLGAETSERCASPFTGSLGPSSSQPLDVTALTNVMGVDAGLHTTCAVIVNGSVQCWGSNGQGQLGDGTTATRRAPVPVCQDFNQAAQECTKPLSGAVDVDTGGFHTCALTTDGSVKCWGGSACCAQFENQLTPVEVTGLGPKPTPTRTQPPTATSTQTAPRPLTPAPTPAAPAPNGSSPAGQSVRSLPATGLRASGASSREPLALALLATAAGVLVATVAWLTAGRR